MEVYCTVCSREKLKTDKPVRAIELYLSPNIKDVYERSNREGLEFRILSGKFGLLGAEDEIEWYDYLLKSEDVEGLKAKLKEQIESQGIDNITFFAENREEHPNWGPYYDAIIRACSELKIDLKLVEI